MIMKKMVTNCESASVNPSTRRFFRKCSALVSCCPLLLGVLQGHSAVVTVETVQPLPVSNARAALEQAAGITVEDDPKRLYYPLATRVIGHDTVFVGRIRTDHSVPHGLQLWVVADNLRPGGALNAVQIVEHLMTIAD